MCCILTVLALIGPRAAIIVWWIADPSRWDRAFSTFVWPLVGFIFAPWTTLMYVAVEPVHGFDWVWIALALFVDISLNTGGAYRNRERVTVYTSR
jgi:hypothetical protein